MWSYIRSVFLFVCLFLTVEVLSVIFIGARGVV